MFATAVLVALTAQSLEPKFLNMTLKDSVRSKDLQIRVSYPATGGPYPLIVYSHGLGGSKEAYRPLVDEWVRHGYVVVQPTHADAFQNMSEEDRRKLLTKSGKPIGDASQRPKDIVLCLDSIKTIQEKVPGKINAEKIGMGGHSYGAWTTMSIGGMKAIVGRREFDSSDPRPKCLLLLSPQGTGPAYPPESFKTLSRPTMTVSGTEDTDPFTASREPIWRTEPYKYQPKGDKWLVWIDSATHGLGGISGRVGPDQDAKMLASVHLSTLAFWDTYLKGSGNMKAVSSKNLTSVAGHTVTVSSK